MKNSNLRNLSKVELVEVFGGRCGWWKASRGNAVVGLFNAAHELGCLIGRALGTNNY